MQQRQETGENMQLITQIGIPFILQFIDAENAIKDILETGIYYENKLDNSSAALDPLYSRNKASFPKMLTTIDFKKTSSETLH